MTQTKIYIIVNFIYSASLIVFGSYIYCFQFLINLKFNSLFRQEFFNMFKEIKMNITRNKITTPNYHVNKFTFSKQYQK